MAVESEFTFDKKDSDKTALVARGKDGDKIDVMLIASDDQLDKSGYRYAYAKGVDDEYKPVEPELLEDKAQNQLARELADLPLRDDVVIARQHGALVEGRVDDYVTIESPAGSHRYGEFVGPGSNKSRVRIEDLSLDAQAELDEQKNKKFLAEAKKLVEQSEGLEDSAKRQIIDAYLSSVDRAVRAGDFVDPAGNVTYNLDQLENGFNSLVKDLDAYDSLALRTSVRVMKSIPRSNGLRDAFTTFLLNGETSAVFEQALRDKYEKEPTIEAKVQRPLGHTATEGVDIVPPFANDQESSAEAQESKVAELKSVQEAISELTKDVSHDDLRRLLQLHSATTAQEIETARKGMTESLRGKEKLIIDYLVLADKRARLRISLGNSQ